MEKDIDEIKPRKWLVVLLILIAIAISIVLINKVVTDKNEKDKNKESHSIFDIFNIDKIENSFEKESFNSDFEFYVGTKTGTSLSRLIDEIITNNKKNKEHLITVIYNEINTTDTEQIKTLKDNIKTFDKYEISADYDELGFINKITIQLTEKDMSEVRGFNSDYEFYSGTENGFSVKRLLDKVITNNKTNDSRILAVIYKDTNTTDVEIIKNLKSNFDDWTDYEISLNYNEEGYVYQIVIE